MVEGQPFLNGDKPAGRYSGLWEHTAKGYRFLTGYPGQFFFNVFLSFLARFDIYSDITFVRLAFDEGSWVAKPSLLVLLVGVVVLQVIPAITLFADFNILMQLVYAQTTNEQ
uniref:Uncharacterized protein n=1 Tax=Pyrodinium bahamense TaxID=73915 RepID=A0A7R9ZWL8_9DINO|mmetsp:Transcript_12311/g.33829  ORF Transcript_12311/g.33829 Transcript_12311/m.33829 type:complete len:112 (+) Transcript_12311:69-404(+)